MERHASANRTSFRSADNRLAVPQGRRGDQKGLGCLLDSTCLVLYSRIKTPFHLASLLFAGAQRRYGDSRCLPGRQPFRSPCFPVTHCGGRNSSTQEEG